jgi:hypothetical protein
MHKPVSKQLACQEVLNTGGHGIRIFSKLYVVRKLPTGIGPMVSIFMGILIFIAPP